jgi:hypothetical protein
MNKLYRIFRHPPQVQRPVCTGRCPSQQRIVDSKADSVVSVETKDVKDAFDRLAVLLKDINDDDLISIRQTGGVL